MWVSLCIYLQTALTWASFVYSLHKRNIFLKLLLGQSKLLYEELNY